MIALPENAMAPALASARPCRRWDLPSGLFKVGAFIIHEGTPLVPVAEGLVVTRHQQLDFRWDGREIDLDVDARRLAARKGRSNCRRDLVEARDVHTLRTKCARDVVIACIA